MNDLYYQAPTDKQFQEVKDKAIEIWNTYDDTYGYRTEKVNRIKDLKNIKDNVMYMVAMFDTPNQVKLSYKLSGETRKVISDRIKDAGTPNLYNNFLEEGEL